MVSSSYRNTALFKMDGTTLLKTSSSGTYEDEIVREVKTASGATFTWTLTVNSPSYDYDDRGIWLSNVVWVPDEVVATPVIDGPQLALLDGPVDARVSCATEGAMLHYTLDGSDPTEASPVVSGGTIRIMDDATLKVRAYRDGMGPSAVASARYLKKAEPGAWTTDAERARLSAAIDGSMICVAKLKASLSHWKELSPILNSDEFLHWAAANGIYLVKWDSDADASGASASAEWMKALYAQRGSGSLYNWEMCFALPMSPDVLCGYARAYGSYSVGSVKYDGTVSGMTAGFASILSGNGLTPIPPEVIDIVALLDGARGDPEYDAAVGKVIAIAAGGNPAVEPGVLRDWIAERGICPADIAYGDYVATSAKLGTGSPITDGAEVKFVNVETGGDCNGFVFRFELTLAGNDSPEELAFEREAIAECIETTCSLEDGFHETVDPLRVTIGGDGSVAIAPVTNRTSEFFRISIPKDPETLQ